MENLKKKQVQTWKVAIYLLSLVIIVLGLSYASVPLYQLFCQATGFGGTVQKTETNTSIIEKENKETIENNIKSIKIKFNGDTNEKLPWTFKPTMKTLEIYAGDPALTFYIAKNNSDEAITGISTYHVTPAKAGIYFNKIQCFCFEEQRLKGGETIEMPVLFFIDSDFKNDPKMQDVETITLSYTFYRSDFE